MSTSMKVLAIGLLATVAFVAACESEIDDKPAAVVAEAEAEEATAEADDGVETRELAFDVESSSIGWVGAKVTGDHVGGFEEWTGTAVAAEDELRELNFTVDTRSIFSDDDDLTGHLKSDDFFDVEEYPEASFRSTRIAAYDGEGATHQVTGNFTIRGVTKSVTFPATIDVDDDGANASAEFTIERFDFGIEYKGMPDDLIRNEVLLKIDLAAS